MSALRRQTWRFLLVGGSNTLVTAVLLAVLSQFLDPRVAYTIVFAAGLAYSTMLTSTFVFSARASRGRLAAFVAWYLAVYLVGLGVVHAVDRDGDTSRAVLAIVTVCVTAPLSFLGGRLIFGGGSGGQVQQQASQRSER